MSRAKKMALENIIILDFTRMLAGPFATMLLADQGANIIKIEPSSGDYTRSVGPHVKTDAEKRLGGYFQSVNRNKRSIAIDLKNPAAKDIIYKLVKKVDVVVENFKTGVMEKLGLSFETLIEINPKLVYAAIRGFGDPRTGQTKYTNWPAYDVVAQAMGGIMSVTGDPTVGALKVGPGVGDIYPATLSAFGITAALLHAQQTGEGQFVDVSMVDAVLALTERIIFQYSYEGIIAKPQGRRHPLLVPFGVVKCQNGDIALACPTDADWSKLCRLIEAPEFAIDQRTATELARRDNQPLVYDIIENFTKNKTKAELEIIFGGKVPFAPVNTSEDIFRNEYFHKRMMLPTVDEIDGSKVSVAGVPIKMTRTPGHVYRRAPIIGEHTKEILIEFGFTSVEINKLFKDKVIF